MDASSRSTGCGPAPARIRVTNLTKRFKRIRGAGEVVPVDDVTLEIPANEMVVLLGPSGCGKTTLLRCVAGLERPDAGEIHIDDQLVFSAEKKVFIPPNRRPISMIFQSYALWPHMTLFENIAYPLRSRRVTSREIPGRVETALSMVGLEGLGSQYPGQISGGQQQRVALARAIISGTNVILFDEPLSNVDAKVRESLRVELLGMQRELGFSGLYVTHDQHEAMAVADRIAVLSDGRVEQLAPPQEVYSYPANRYVGTFIGLANLVDGRISARTGSIADIETEHGRFEVDTSGQQALVQDFPDTAGSAVTVLTRPEQVRLTVGHEQSGTNRLTGVVQTRMYLGSQTQYVVLVGDAAKRFIVITNEATAAEEGDDVTLSFDRENLRILHPQAERVVTN
jgi:ABC-type Fe3+/spermidine/putrescine transport system ATPase subunit